MVRIKEMKLIAWIGCVALAAAQPVPKELDGRWRTTKVSKEGIGAIYLFANATEVAVSTGPLAAGRYKVEGQDVVLPEMAAGGGPMRFRMDFSTPGILRLNQGGKTVLSLSRIGVISKGEPKLEGIWTTDQEVQGKKYLSTYFFYPDGRSFFFMIFETVRAKVKIQDGRMTIRFPNGKTAEGPYSRKGTTLTIPSLREGVSTVLEAY
jgi:hypothetical protein